MKLRPHVRVGALTLAVLLSAQALALPGGARARQTAEGFDVGALLSEVAQNERAMLGRRLEYTWTARVTDRELDRRGVVKKESVSVYEVYPVRGEFARKLVSKDGVAVSKEREAEELKRAAERLEKAAHEEQNRAEQEGQKRAEQKPPPPPPPQKTADAQNPAGLPSFGFSSGHRSSSGFSSSEISMSVWRFFRYGEFTSPRRERFHERDTIVLDFRPRANFRPADELQRPYARLAGRLWIDAQDKTVARLEAWPYDPRATGAGSPAAALEPSVVFEHERLPDGVWLEHFFRIKTYGHKDIFNGLELDLTREATAFQRFDTAAGDEKLDTPKP
ncbi:MAG TPA: hypothetical protein VJ866_04285 [Pyrinomonadaceae bacterium]|nr:hypothetical protein [Pyrinomonadaceae bacterium]